MPIVRVLSKIDPKGKNRGGLEWIFGVRQERSDDAVLRLIFDV